MDLLDIATIRDVRTGQYAKKPKVCKAFILISAYRKVITNLLLTFLCFPVIFDSKIVEDNFLW